MLGCKWNSFSLSVFYFWLHFCIVTINNVCLSDVHSLPSLGSKQRTERNNGQGKCKQLLGRKISKVNAVSRLLYQMTCLWSHCWCLQCAMFVAYKDKRTSVYLTNYVADYYCTGGSGNGNGPKYQPAVGSVFGHIDSYNTSKYSLTWFVTFSIRQSYFSENEYFPCLQGYKAMAYLVC